MNASYQKVIDQVMESIESGVLPWKRPWQSFLPQNSDGRVYRGLNLFALSMTQYNDPRWITFKKAQELGGQVRKGEKSRTVYFWQFLRVGADDEGKGGRSVPLLKIYHVFNVSQCDGLEKLKPLATDLNDGTPNEKAERIIANLPWSLKINEGLKAFWSPSQPDAVTMPKQSTFHSMDEWYSTLFHEIGHATGHNSRLNRDMSHQDEAYSFEELVAEFTAAMLCAHCGIDNTLGNTASYIAGWSKRLKSEPMMIIKAAGLAQKACDYILGTQFGANAQEPTAEQVEDASKVA